MDGHNTALESETVVSKKVTSYELICECGGWEVTGSDLLELRLQHIKHNSEMLKQVASQLGYKRILSTDSMQPWTCGICAASISDSNLVKHAEWHRS